MKNIFTLILLTTSVLLGEPPMGIENYSGSTHLYFILFVGITLGVIFMASVYNAGLYYYHKKKAFLYYALMQLGMIQILLIDTQIIHSDMTKSLYYELISLFTLFFILLFSRAFLDTTKYFPIHNKILSYLLIFIAMDALFYPIAIIFDNGLYILVLLYILFLGYKKVKLGYKPAKFFLIGWSLCVLSVITDRFIDLGIDVSPYVFNPMYIGTILEAILLAFALAYQFSTLDKEKEQQKQLLIHQSKLASMGEMLGNIAHQWRQPLTRLSYTFMNIETSDSTQERSTLVAEGTKQLEYMSQTINDFTDFYAPSKEKEYFSIVQACQEVLDLLHYYEIDINIQIIEEYEVLNYKNEFKQVLLNLLSNAKDTLLSRKTLQASIHILIDKNIISIEDNAGGIALKNIEKIFEPYFSTKDNGLGIGLYMSKIIIEKNMEGTLSVKNTRKGAMFSIAL